MGKSSDSIAGLRKLTVALLALLWLPFVFAQPPTAAADGDPNTEAFIGSTVTVPLTFSNPGADTGYGPFVDVFMPTADGISLESVHYGPLDLTLRAIGGPQSGWEHPYRKGADGNPLLIDIPSGETLYVFELPYGSVAGNVTPHELDFNIAVSREAQLNDGIPYRVHAGFHSDNPQFTGAGQYHESGEELSVTPILARLHKEVSAAEDETAVGRHFPNRYTITAEIAPGETLDSLVVTDTLPNNIVITDIPVQSGWEFSLNYAGSECEPAGTDPQLEAGPCNNWELTATYTGAGGASGSQSFHFDFFVPLNDADGAPVAAGGSGGRVINEAEGSGTWSNAPAGQDPAISIPEVIHETDIRRNRGTGNGSGNDTSGIMMVQKTASATTVGPGTEVTFTIDFQISDHSAYTDVRLLDTLGDGLVYLNDSADLQINQHGELAPPSLTVEGPTSGPNGAQDLVFRVTPSDGLLLGACVHEDLDDDETCAPTGTRGRLTYTATVLDAYRSPVSDNHTHVVQGDDLLNEVEIRGTVLNTDPESSNYLKATDIEDYDDSAVTLHVPRTEIKKSIVAINNTPVDTADEDIPLIAAGDTVTFSLQATLPTSDFRDFVITDELPVPVFDASEFGSATLSWSDQSDDFPAAGQAVLVGSGTPSFPGPDCSPSPAPSNPTVRVLGDSNAVEFDFGHYNCDGSVETTIEIYLTATVQDVALNDGFIINNRMIQGENEASVATANRLLRFTRPQLNITKGVVGVSEDSPVAKQLELVSGTPIRSEVNRADYNDDQSGIDAGDTVTYAIIIENTGQGTKGAHGITLFDDFLDIAGMDFVAGSLKFWLGNGVEVEPHGDLFDPNSGGLTFSVGGNPLVLARGRNEDGTVNTAGDNILIVTYEATVAADIDPWYVHTNTASVTDYRSHEHSSLNLTNPQNGGRPVEDNATVRVTLEAPTKSVVAKSENTTDNGVLVGEIIRYRIVAPVPEGVAAGFVIHDELPPGLQFLNDQGTVRAALISNGGGLSSSDHTGDGLHIPGDGDANPSSADIAFVLPSTAISSNLAGGQSEFGDGTDVYFHFGTLTNADRDADQELVIVEFNALVLNGTNASGVNRDNYARTHVDGRETGRSNQERLALRQPSLVVEKTVDAQNGEKAAGDQITYTVTVRNTGNAPAYLVEVADELSTHLTAVSVGDPAQYNAAENLVTLSLDELPASGEETFTITATIRSDTPTGIEIVNTVTATASSLPGGTGSTADEGNTTGSTTPGGNGDPSGARTYDADDDANFTTAIVGPQKRIIATSETHTEEATDGLSADVAIGEIVRYSLTVSVPAGYTEGLTFTDTLPADLQFLPEADNNVTISAVGSGIAFDDTDFGGAVNATIAFPNTVGLNGQDVIFEIGNVTNTPPLDGDSTITIAFNALVLDDSDNVAGGELTNVFTATSAHSTATSNPVTVTVVEPALEVTKAVAEVSEGVIDSDGNASGVDRDGIVTFRVTISNSGATAFGVTLTDALPAGFAPEGTPTTVPSGGYTAAFTGQELTVTGDPGTALENGQEVVVTYQARVRAAPDSAAPGAGGDLINTAIATATSLPDGGTPATDNPTGSRTPQGGERVYTGDEDIEGTHVSDMSDTAMTTIAEPVLSVSKRLVDNYPVNNADGTYTVHYDITVTNTGNIDLVDVQLTDDLSEAFADLAELVSASATGHDDVNTAFNGATDTALFSGAGISLGHADNSSATVTVEAVVRLDNVEQLSPTEHENTVTATGQTAGGLEPVPASDTEPVGFNEDPAIAVSKAVVGDITNHEDGSFTVTYVITVENRGDVNLSSVSLLDPLNVYGSDATIHAVSTELQSSTSSLVLNAGYDGLTDTDILVPGDSSLAAEVTETVHVAVTVTPANSEALYTNVVIASGTSPTGAEVSDEDKVEHTFTVSPAIAVATCLPAGGIVANPELPGQYRVTFSVLVRNFGNVQLNNVSTTLDLAAIFQYSDWFSLVEVDGDHVSTTYDGGGNTELFTPDTTLHSAAQVLAAPDLTDRAEFTVTVDVIPGSMLAYAISALAEGESPLIPAGEDSGWVRAVSVDDCDLFAEDTEDPEPDTPVPTPVDFPDGPLIGIAKAFTGLTAVPDEPGTFDITFTFVVRNYGNVTLTEISLEDDFQAAFDSGGGADWEITAITADAPLQPADDYTHAAETGALLNPESFLNTEALASFLEDGSHEGTVTVTLRVTPEEPGNDFFNTATATGSDPYEEPVSDDSVDGDDPDSGGDNPEREDGDGDPTNNDSPTPFTFESPLIGVAKDAPLTFDFGSGPTTNPRNVGDGTYQVGYVFTIVNYGDVPLHDLFLADDLVTQLAAGTPIAFEAVDGSLAGNPLWDGTAGSNILADGQTLAFDETQLAKETVAVIVTLEPGAALGQPGGLILENQATVQGTSPGGNTVEDDSNAGTNPDNGQPGDDNPEFNDDGDPTNNGGPTTVVLEESPAVGLAKAAEVTPVGDGRYDVLFTFTVRNYGDIELRNLQLTDSLTDAFGADTYVVQSLWSPTLTVNALAPASGSPAAYDGDANLNLLAGTDTLPVGGEATVELLVRVKPAEARTYENVATTTGTTPGGQPVEDDSTDGFDPDPDGDDDPSNNDDPTPVPFEENPLIGVAKAAEVTANEDGSFNIDLTFTIGNYGDVPLKNVTLSDPLTGIYSITDLTPARVSVTSSQLTVNPDYDGQTNAEILAGTDTLAVGAFREVRVRLSSVRPVSGTSTTNTAVARGESPTGTPVEDDSTDGFDPDPDGNDDPTDNDEPTPIELERITQIALAKSGSLSFDADGLLNLEFTFTVRNTGNITLHGVQVRDDLEEYWANTNLTSAMIDVTSSDFTANPAFDGQADDQLLTGSDSLAPGRTGTVTVTLSGFTANDGVTELYNTALATARDPDGNPTEDPSNDGDDPIPGEDVPTRTDLRENPLLGVAKNADRVVVEEDGSFTVAFTLTLTNYGNTDLVNMSLTDDLQQFVDGGMTSATVTSTDLPVNGSFNGTTDQELLGAGANLAIGESAQLTLVLSGITQAGTYENQAVAEGESPGGTPTPPDRSTDGTDPDPDGDGDPTNNDDPTPVVLENDPILGVAKRARVTQAEAGSWDITFTILVRNMGNTHLADIQVTDDLSDFADGGTNFPGGATLSVSSADFPVNGAYDGLTDTDLLGSGASLAAGAEGTVTVTLSGFASEERTQFENSATGTGTPPSGEPVRDDSQNGNDPDPDGDGDPTNNDDPTPVELVTRPAIGIAKKADITKHEDGTFDVVFTMTVGNYGNTVLENVQVRDSLLELYGPTNLSADHISVESGDFTPNPAYDGLNDLNLLTGTDSLGLDETGTLTLSLTGISIYEQVDTYNTAIASGTDPGGKPARPDESQDGDDPDPDGDGNPGNNNDPTPVHLVVNPLIGLAKAAETTDLGDGSYDVVFTLTLVNYGDVPLSDLSISDPLTAFYENTSLSAADISVASADLSVNAAYDGATVTELLSGSNTLASGAEATLTITLSGITPDAGVTRLDNSAYASGRAPDGSRVSDTSQDGTNPDPDGDGNPGNNSDPTPVFFDGNVALLLQKDANPGPYGIGDRVTYTLTLTNPNDTTTSVTLTDVIPQRTQYIEATAAFDPAGTAPSEGPEPRQDEDGVLTWRAIVLPAGESVTVTYDLRILAGATSPLVNTATLSAGTDVTAQASTSVELDQGVFDLDRSTLIGRVYIDVNRNATYDEGIDIPLENARVVLANGWQTLTDEQGNYAFRELDSGTWTVMVDQLTTPYDPQAHPEQLRDPRQHRVDVRGLTVSDFPFEDLAGLASSRRETFVTFGDIELHKYQVPLGSTVRTVIEVTAGGEWPPVLITDPVPGSDAREFIVELTGDEPVFLTYDLPAGTQLTDPVIEWSNR